MRKHVTESPVERGLQKFTNSRDMLSGRVVLSSPGIKKYTATVVPPSTEYGCLGRFPKVVTPYACQRLGNLKRCSGRYVCFL